MKVQFRDNYLIYRTSVEGMSKVIVDVASNDGEQQEALAILKLMGWTLEEITRFDDEWAKATEGKDIEVSEYSDVYKVLTENVDLTQFWCMK
jgi:hypothetical protein